MITTTEHIARGPGCDYTHIEFKPEYNVSGAAVARATKDPALFIVAVRGFTVNGGSPEAGTGYNRGRSQGVRNATILLLRGVEDDAGLIASACCPLRWGSFPWPGAKEAGRVSLLVFISAFDASEGGVCARASWNPRPAGCRWLHQARASPSSPSSSLLSPDRKFLYATHAPGDFGGKQDEQE